MYRLIGSCIVMKGSQWHSTALEIPLISGFVSHEYRNHSTALKFCSSDLHVPDLDVIYNNVQINITITVPLS